MRCLFDSSCVKRKPDFPTASIAGRAFGNKLDFNKVRAFSIEGKVPDGELEIEAEDADGEEMQTYFDEKVFPGLIFHVHPKRD